MTRNALIYRLYATSGESRDLTGPAQATHWLAYAAALAGAFDWANSLAPMAQREIHDCRADPCDCDDCRIAASDPEAAEARDATE